ncbi:MAG: hypothetical protein EBZ77_13770, partial [Chitinophagia bacterium]|nr:hypothetical protein [Chitinophagia bacterium]
ATITYNTGCGTVATSTITVNATPAISLGTVPVTPAGAATVTIPFTTSGAPATYSLTWNAAALAAGFTNISSATLSGSPLTVAVSPTALTGSYLGYLTVNNGTCTGVATSFNVSFNIGKRIHTYAGISSNGYSGDNGAAVLGKLSNPYDVATDRKGNLYIADYGNGVVRKVAPTGVITTVAGNGSIGYSGDGGAATTASLSNPIGVAVDTNDNLYIADYNNHVIRKVSANGIISTVAGNATHGYSGDGGAATAAALNYPIGLETDRNGNLYICDYLNSAIRKVSASGIITTVAGSGTNGYSGDGGAATAAQLGYPRCFVVDTTGNLFIADYANQVIRKVNTSGIISTFAGTGSTGYTGDGGPASAATFNTPYGIALDGSGNLYVSEKYNYVVRKISTSGYISTYAGNGLPGYMGDGNDASNCKLDQPMGLAVDTNNNVYICDNANFAVRIVGDYNRTPFFPAANPTAIVCRNATAVSIDSIMKGTDFDTTQTIVWSLITAPTHGTFAGSSTQTSTGRALPVSGFTYSPDSNYIGNDSFVVRITDGPTFTDNKVRVQVHGNPAPGVITGAGLVCITSVIHV